MGPVFRSEASRSRTPFGWRTSPTATSCPNKSVKPTDFATLSLFYSTPEAPVKTRNRKGVVVPHEAKHHKYVHSIQTHAIHDLKDIPDQEWAESIHTM